MVNPEAIGLIAGALTTASFLPQLLRVWHRRSAEDLSYTALGTFVVGISMWLLYGLMIHSTSVIIANAVTLALNVSIVVVKWTAAKREASSARR